MEKEKKQRKKTQKPNYYIKVFKKTKDNEIYYQVIINKYPIILNETEVNTLLDKLKEINTTAHFVLTSIKEI